MAGTPILTPAGYRPIESLRPGDAVTSWNLSSQEPVARRILSVHQASATSAVEIRAASGHIPGVTSSHPVFDAARAAFVPALLIGPGDMLLVWTGASARHARVEAVRTVQLQATHQTVYDLTVQGPEHNFFAGGILVHNKTPIAPPCPSSLAVASTSPLDGSTNVSLDTSVSLTLTEPPPQHSYFSLIVFRDSRIIGGRFESSTALTGEVVYTWVDSGTLDPDTEYLVRWHVGCRLPGGVYLVSEVTFRTAP